jgi:hypothetical protein
MAWRLGVRDADVRRHFWITFADCVWRNPRAIRYVGSFSALYLHFGPFARLVSARITREIDALSAVEADTGEVLQSGGGRRRAGAETHPTELAWIACDLVQRQLYAQEHAFRRQLRSRRQPPPDQCDESAGSLQRGTPPATV